MVDAAKAMTIATKTDELGRDSAVPGATGIRFCEISFFAPVRFRANLNPILGKPTQMTEKKGSGTFFADTRLSKKVPDPFFPTTTDPGFISD